MYIMLVHGTKERVSRLVKMHANNVKKLIRYEQEILLQLLVLKMLLPGIHCAMKVHVIVLGIN